MCTGPATRPATMRLLLIFRRARPGNAWPFDVGTDMSTMQPDRSVRLPDAVAFAADEGRMMCSPDWFEMPMFLAAEKLGLRMLAPLGFESSSL